ncbi:MAG: hypothetical protein NVSMB26_29520 [Beijerinckiaceae bacterium]
MRARIVRRGVQVVCGSADFVPASAAADVSLLSGGLRLAWLRALGAIGRKSFVATSGLGYDFVCHIGDLSEYPFYHPRAYEKEVALCAAWLRGEQNPVVYDLGANVGFISVHLAQMLATRSPQIYAFEPVPTTFVRLADSVRRLGLSDRVYPIAAAITDAAGSVRIGLSRRNSLVSQIILETGAAASGNEVAHAKAITLDEFSASRGTHPSLVKMDIEGSEVAALRGAQQLLSRADRPGILFEHNPATLAQCGTNAGSLHELLNGYELFYVDDLAAQKLPFGSLVRDAGQIDWICNLFAVPRDEAAAAKWDSALSEARHQIENPSARDGKVRSLPG